MTVWHVPTLLALTLLVGPSAVAGDELRQQGWPLPDMDKASHVDMFDKEMDLFPECPGKDVTREVWAASVDDLSPGFRKAYGVALDPDQVLLFTVTRLLKGDRIVSFSFDTDKTHPMDTVILDVDGDGVFRLESHARETKAPAWILKHCGR